MQPDEDHQEYLVDDPNPVCNVKKNNLFIILYLIRQITDHKILNFFYLIVLYLGVHLCLNKNKN